MYITRRELILYLRGAYCKYISDAVTGPNRSENKRTRRKIVRS